MAFWLYAADVDALRAMFGPEFHYKKYYSLHRHAPFRISKRFDVWHSLNQNTKIEPLRKPGKYVLTVHDVNFVEEKSADSKAKHNRRFAEKLSRADVITYISEFAKWQTHQYFNVPAVEERIIYNGNPIVHFENLRGFAPRIIPKMPFFFTLGDFIERKNFISLVQMMAHTDGFQLVISGNNQKPYGDVVRRAIIDLNLQEKVILTGKITEKEKQYYMRECAAFLFPSIREGFGLPPIEAMRFEKPVFLSTHTAMPEIGGDAAFYWQNFDPIAMKDLLFQRLSDFDANPDDYREKLRTRADFFSWDKAAAAYIDCYKP